MSPFRTRLSGPIPIRFDVVARPVMWVPDGSALGCPECHAPIDLHQPDENQPNNLLGTCLECSRWFLVIEIQEASRRTLIVDLPCADKIREVFAASGSHG